MSTTLLGPQEPSPTVAGVLEELGVKGPVALVASGWQEREEDPSVGPDLGVPVVNLALHGRSEDVFRRDRQLAEAYKARQTRLKEMQDVYRLRLDHAGQVTRAIAVRALDPKLFENEKQASLEQLRALDQQHADRCQKVHAEFTDRFGLTRPELARHREELKALIAPTDALVIAGGHVASLLNRLRLFELLSLIGDRPVVAWSAGAMVLTERLVLFHDHPPVGEAICEILDVGLGVVRRLVALPDTRHRLMLNDPDRVASFAQRFAPATCVALDPGGEVIFGGGTTRTKNVQRLTLSGGLEGGWA